MTLNQRLNLTGGGLALTSGDSRITSKSRFQRYRSWCREPGVLQRNSSIWLAKVIMGRFREVYMYVYNLFNHYFIFFSSLCVCVSCIQLIFFLSLNEGIDKYLGQILSLETVLILFPNKLIFRHFKGLIKVLSRNHRELSAWLQPTILFKYLIQSRERLRSGAFYRAIFPSTINLIIHKVIITLKNISIFFSFTIWEYWITGQITSLERAEYFHSLPNFIIYVLG